MAAKEFPDVRMVERAARRPGGATNTAADDARLPDLAANVATVSADDLEKLRADLTTEQELRTRRIERFIKEGPIKPIPRAVIPVSENDL